MSQRNLVTAALPYANGSIHIGHLVEYAQADIYVRALKRLGEKASYICANDAHGTPIELNARRQGVSPEELIARIHDEHQRDFATFDIAFDNFSSTHTETNRAIVEAAYAALESAGQIESREIDGNWCNQDERFLPDRFIKGRCPNCDANDQYGDVCEVCGRTYTPNELKSPYCVICGEAPVTRRSEHVFFKLSQAEHTRFLNQWIDSGALQTDVANYVRTWVEGGLKDWDISRDGPYFGFAIPDKKEKYFYVWLDAPFGYVASSTEWAKREDIAVDDLWRSAEKTRITHVIGKDIVYFHTLFWPAVLRCTGYTLPSRVQVHGMLTVDGEKMSKSRGTFINAATFANHLDPQALRYYYACKLSSSTDDLDLALDDFVARVNAELVNKHANLFSRALQFLSQKLDGKLGDLPFTAEEAQAEPIGDGSPLDLARRVVAGCRRVEAHYRAFDFSLAMRELSAVADIGNEFVQAQEPWVQLKGDPEEARQTCTFAANVCHALATYLWPVVPRFADAGAAVLGSDISRMEATRLFRERNRPIGEFQRLYERIDKKAVAGLLEASRETLAPIADEAADESAEGGEQITFDEFGRLELRVGIIRHAERIKKSKKLLRLEVDLGETELRQLVAGIAEHYSPDAVVGKRVVVVANLAPAKIMGVESRGMVLAANTDELQAVLGPDKDMPAGTRVS